MHTMQNVADKADNQSNCAEGPNVSKWHLIAWFDDGLNIISQDGEQGRSLMALALVHIFPEHSSVEKIPKISFGFST